MKKPDGGTAFHYGMSLRDYFAAQALPAIIAKTSERDMAGNTAQDLREASAVGAYLLADAMLKAREQ